MEKSAISRQNLHIGTGTKSGYRYPLDRGKVVPVPIKVVSVPMLPATLFYVPLALLSLVFVHRLFRDPNKGLMGVQIRMKLSEKHTIPHRLGEANSLGKLSVLTQYR